MTDLKKKNDAEKHLFRYTQKSVYRSKLVKWITFFAIIGFALLIDPLSQAHGNGNNLPPNHKPVAVDTIASVTLGADPVTVDVSDKFSDADGDTLTYTAVSSADAIVTAHVDGSKVTISRKAQGYATIVVTATDPWGLQVTQNIAVLPLGSTPVIKYIIVSFVSFVVFGVVIYVFPIIFDFSIRIGPKFKIIRSTRKTGSETGPN